MSLEIVNFKRYDIMEFYPLILDGSYPKPQHPYTATLYKEFLSTALRIADVEHRTELQQHCMKVYFRYRDPDRDKHLADIIEGIIPLRKQ